MDIARRFFTQSVYSFKSLFGFLDPKIYILVKVINPAFQIMFFSLLAQFAFKTKDISPWIIGNSFLLCTYNAMFGVGTVMISERYMGTLKLVVASPANKFLVFAGRAFMHVIDAAITVAIGLLVGVLFFEMRIPLSQIPVFILAIFTAMFSASAMGLLVGSLGLITRDINLLLNTASMLLLGLSGATFPLERLPGFLQGLSNFLPLTRSIKAARLVAEGISRGSGNLMLGEILVGIAYMTAGYILLVALENIAKTKGTLDIY